MDPVIRQILFLVVWTIPAWSIAAWMFYTWDIGGIRSDIEKAKKEKFRKRQRDRLAKIINDIKISIEREKRNEK